MLCIFFIFIYTVIIIIIIIIIIGLEIHWYSQYEQVIVLHTAICIVLLHYWKDIFNSYYFIFFDRNINLKHIDGTVLKTVVKSFTFNSTELKTVRGGGILQTHLR